ncbi:hypothetical protein B1810_17615 [Panacagrimonas perspica]|nr:hypothetical protein B1810_17615 [Panacagrimonas perspica]
MRDKPIFRWADAINSARLREDGCPLERVHRRADFAPAHGEIRRAGAASGACHCKEDETRFEVC